MNRSFIFLAPLALLVGGCSSTQSARNTPPPPAQVAAPKPLPAQPAGTLQTAWGELPTYRTEEKGSDVPFAYSFRRYPLLMLPEELRSGDTAVVDVLVNRDGSVSDVKLLASSGVDRVDRYMINTFVGAQALLQIAATDPAPYVVRKTVHVSHAPRSDIGYNEPTNFRVADTRSMGTGAPYRGDNPNNNQPWIPNR